MLQYKREGEEKRDLLFRRIRGRLQDSLGLALEYLECGGSAMATGSLVALGHAKETAKELDSPNIHEAVKGVEMLLIGLLSLKP